MSNTGNVVSFKNVECDLIAINSGIASLRLKIIELEERRTELERFLPEQERQYRQNMRSKIKA